MDRLAEAVAAYLCQHRSVGLLRLTLDLTRRRLDLFAEIGAVEVVKGAVAPPTPGTDAWWRAVAAVREAVYVLHERGWPSTCGRPRWSGPAYPVDNPTPSRLTPNPAKPPSPTAKNGVLFPPFPLLRLYEAPKNGASTSLNAV
jgi:hypothetical protein